MMIQVCKKCNRVKIDEEDWSEDPSTRITPESKNAEPVDKCDYCSGKTKLPDKPEPVKKPVTPKKEPEAVKETDLVETGDQKEMANNNHQTLISAKKLMGEALLAFADALRESKEQGYFKFYNESWEAYLCDPDIGIDPSRGRRLMELSRFRETANNQLGEDLNLNDIAEGRFREILPCVKFGKGGTIENMADITEMLDKARTLGHNDFKAEAGEYRATGKSSSMRPPAEKRITEGPVKNSEGNVIGHLTSCWANQKKHTVKIVIDNDYIPDGPLTIVID